MQNYTLLNARTILEVLYNVTIITETLRTSTGVRALEIRVYRMIL